MADEEPLVRQLVCSVLARQGWRVVEAMDGVAALGLSLDETFDLIVTDSQMPTISGLELAAFVRRRSPDMPVLVISGLRGVEADTEELGYRFLLKPFALDQLVLLVGSLTAHQAYVEGLLPMGEPELSHSAATRP